MKYYVYLADDNKTICSVSYDKMDDSIEIDTEIPSDDLAFSGYQYINGQLVKNDKNYNEYKLNEIRELRDEICFPIINRGELWYNTLTSKQLEELNVWYRDWLDATQTKVIPEKPNWLK